MEHLDRSGGPSRGNRKKRRFDEYFVAAGTAGQHPEFEFVADFAGRPDV
jgi:hypothetical protein